MRAGIGTDSAFVVLSTLSKLFTFLEPDKGISAEWADVDDSYIANAISCAIKNPVDKISRLSIASTPTRREVEEIVQSGSPLHLLIAKRFPLLFEGNPTTAKVVKAFSEHDWEEDYLRLICAIDLHIVNRYFLLGELFKFSVERNIRAVIRHYLFLKYIESAKDEQSMEDAQSLEKLAGIIPGIIPLISKNKPPARLGGHSALIYSFPLRENAQGNFYFDASYFKTASIIFAASAISS